MFMKCILLLFVLSFVESEFSYYRSSTPSCTIPRIKNGRARSRQKGTFLKFSCNAQYTLVGNKYATCRFGQWDVPIPVCVKTGCQELEEVKNAVNMTSHNNAWVIFFCLPGYQLVGSPVLYCDGTQWNSTVPGCYDSSNKTETACDFEQPNICGWKPDEYHDFDWKRMQKNTPSSFLKTGPQYDHTYGKNGSGYYMYIESTGRLANETARLISPVYEADLAKNGCFVFWYHMFGRSMGGLLVYQKPAKLSMTMLQRMRLQKNAQIFTLFEQWGEVGNEWHRTIAMLSDFEDNFQIVIEGIRGVSFLSDMAVDDVSLQHGENCTNAMVQGTTPPSVLRSTTEDYSSSVISPQTEELVTTIDEPSTPTSSLSTIATTMTITKKPITTTSTTATTTTTTKMPATTTTATETSATNKSPSACASTSTTNTTTTPRPKFPRKSTPTTSKSKIVTIDVSWESSSTISVVRRTMDDAGVTTADVCFCDCRTNGEG